MIRLEPFWLCTNSLPVQDPFVAIREAAALGFHKIELSAIEGSMEQVRAEDICEVYTDRIRQALSDYGVSCYALSAHTDLSEEACFARFRKKVEFAGEIGAKRVHTRCGSVEKKKVILGNVRKALPLLEKYDLQLNLESYGDLVSEAKTAAVVIEEIDHPLVRYNYDAGNLYRFTDGKLAFAEDLPDGFDVLDCLHLKDVVKKRGYLYNVPVGTGDVGYDEIFAVLGERFDQIGAGIEVPLSFRVRMRDRKIQPVEADLGEAREAIQRSVDFLQRMRVIDVSSM